MTDSESSCSDDFEDAVESVEIAQSPTSKAKRNTMKRGAVTSEEVRQGYFYRISELLPCQVRARGEAEGTKVSPEIEDQIEILTGDQLAERDTRQGYLHRISELLMAQNNFYVSLGDRIRQLLCYGSCLILSP